MLSGAEGGCRGASKALRRKENTFHCSDDYVTVQSSKSTGLCTPVGAFIECKLYFSSYDIKK